MLEGCGGCRLWELIWSFGWLVRNGCCRDGFGVVDVVVYEFCGYGDGYFLCWGDVLEKLVWYCGFVVFVLCFWLNRWYNLLNFRFNFILILFYLCRFFVVWFFLWELCVNEECGNELIGKWNWLIESVVVFIVVLVCMVSELFYRL